MRPNRPPTLAIDTTLLKPGLRLAVGLSGGADSVALLRTLAARGKELGLVLHAAHLHHGLRGEEADGDLAFARSLAAELGLPFHEARVDTAAEARPRLEAGQTGPGKPAETIEEAARRLRYGWFRELMASGEVEAVATAHTRDDQAETVLAKFLRGAWTEGLSGIHPVVAFPEGRILRPLLGVTRAEVELYLGALGQGWREDSSNRHLTFTRNRIRHELLPLLESWNPRLREHLAQMASLAREEEAWWQAELALLGPQLLLPGRAIRGGGRGGGRATGDLLAPSLSIDVTRLAALAPALQRRLLRHAAEELGAAVDFPATEALRALALAGRAGQKRELAQGLRAERTPRELRLAVLPVVPVGMAASKAAPEYTVAIPGEVTAPAFGLRLLIEADSPASRQTAEKPAQADGKILTGQAVSPSRIAKIQAEKSAGRIVSEEIPQEAKTKILSSSVAPVIQASASGLAATLRNWRPGDRVRLRYSASPRKVKEVLERLRVTGSSRALWPVLELDGRIAWMQGVEVEPVPGIRITATSLESSGAALPPMGTSPRG